MIRDQFILDLQSELIVDNFAGGGGASCGIELALGRHVDVAINHDPEAVAMHQINHPQTQHHCESVWDVDPLEVTQGRPVGLAWFSPDCKHFSKAKGGKPREKKIRGLAWIVQRWAALVRPRVIILENVEEFRTWGPLTADGQPCPARKGDTFRSFIRQLQEKGYAVEHRELRACDYGAPTIRKRLFLIARCDGNPIVWPKQTHGAPASADVKAGHRASWRTAAECIDWSLPCPSIFERTKPLAEATQRRIARGIQRYVIEAAEPFIVKYRFSSDGSDIRAPMPTITAGSYVKKPGGAAHALGLCVPTLIQTGYGERPGQAPRVPGLHKPLGTVVDGQKHALVAAFMAKHYSGVIGHHLHGEPLHTVTSTDHNSLVAAFIQRDFGKSIGGAMDEPVGTVTAGGGGHAAEVRAFLVKYYSEGGQDQDCRDPMHTIPTKDRLGLVTVAGEEYQIADIGMRMLEPHELYAAQGFPKSYVFAPVINGKRMPKHAQVRMCGNSVSPPVAAALVRANVPEMAVFSRREIRTMEKAA